jgi:HJR/Mrr/RecB family endonuclease/uncharacterized protein (DUF697 family)
MNFFNRLNIFNSKSNTESEELTPLADAETTTTSSESDREQIPIENSNPTETTPEPDDVSDRQAADTSSTENLAAPQQPESNLWGSAIGFVAGAASKASSKIADATVSVASTAGSAITGAASKAGSKIADATVSAASKAGSAITDAAITTGGKIADVTVSAASTAGSAITSAAVSAGGAIADVTVSAASATGGAILQAPKAIGFLLSSISQSPVLKKLTQNLKVNGWIAAIEAIDIVSAEAEVRKLQQKYPNEKPKEIAHRLIVNKALLAGGTGLVSSLVPGSALLLAGMDLAATTSLSAELVYQIATAYGMDLKSSDRQGEAIAIFGLSVGGNLAIEAGLSLVGTIPIAGALINASGSAALIYALGYGACRFYEAQLEASEIDTKLDVLQDILKAEGDAYLEQVIAQEVTMDWILAYIVRAATPGKTWEQVFAELQATNLNPASLEAIESNLQSPPAIETLLAQINADFAIVLLERCQQIAQSDGVITPEEDALLKLISQKAQIKIQQAEAEQQIDDCVEDVEGQEVQTRPNKLGKLLLATLQLLLRGKSELDRGEVGYLIDRVDKMTGEEFENFLGLCFEKLGYRVQKTPASNDFGADLILSKNNKKTVVQAKRYRGKVGNSAVQEVVAAIKHYNAQDAIAITNSQFTRGARKLAKSNGVALWEREQLIDLIMKAKTSL